VHIDIVMLNAIIDGVNHTYDILYSLIFIYLIYYINEFIRFLLMNFVITFTF